MKIKHSFEAHPDGCFETGLPALLCTNGLVKPLNAKKIGSQNLAKKLEIEGFGQEDWSNNIWTVKSRRLSKQPGKNVLTATLIFNFPPKISKNPLPNDWANLVKALVLLR